MQHKGPRYKTRPFTFWFRLCLKLQSSYRLFLQLGDDDDLYVGLYVSVDLNGDLVGS